MKSKNEVTLLEEALTLDSPDARAAFVEAACAGDPLLRERLHALLDAHQAAAGFLEDRPDRPSPSERMVTEKPGARIGRYKLLQVIGEGGMGVVYMAEQEEPVRRRVALKVIKLGMDTKTVVARFEAERQALALMDHPNIARVLDAGATDSGRPFFVMELVQGMPITRFCDEMRVPTRQRLELFADVCSAVQHAHQKGIIHRDLKPSNILVTMHGDTPVPKVIDFGIAKATQGRLTDKTLFTVFQQFIGTPAYMSPEQASLSGLDIDTRSDIYSLGVLLYELLTGRTPIEARALFEGGIDEMRRIIREKEPPRPSTRLSTLQAGDLSSTAQSHRTEVPRLIQLLRGDLDWIVMKAIEKDRARRYETANGIAADIRRYLNNEPVTARPPSTGYRLRKAFLRHKLGFAAAGAVSVALLIGFFATSWQSTARKKALTEARRTLYVSQMQAVQRIWEQGNIHVAREILRSWIPRPGEEDLRGFEWRHFATLCRDESFLTLTNEVQTGATSVAISPDGSLLASGDRYGEVYLHRTADWSLVRRIRAHSGQVNSVEFSRDGQWLASSSGDRFASVYSVANGEIRASFIVTNVQLLTCARFSPDATMLAVGGYPAETLNLYDLVASNEVARFSGQVGDVRHASFSPDGRFLAINNGALDIQVRDLQTREVVQKLAGHKSIVGVVEYSPDGRWLASSEGTGAIKLWDTRDWREVATLHGHRTVVMALAFSSDSKTLASSCRDSLIRLWDVETKSEVATLRGHWGWVSRLAFFPGGRQLLSTGNDEIKLWSVPERQHLPSFRNEPVLFGQAQFSPDGTMIATLGNDTPSRRLWNAQSGELVASLDGKTSPGAFSPDSRLYAARGDSNEVRVWNTATGEALKSLSLGTNAARDVIFTRQGQLLVSMEGQEHLRRWHLQSGSELEPLRGFDGGIVRVHQSLDFRWAAALCADGNIRIFETDSGAIRRIFPFFGDSAEFGFSPDNNYVALALGGNGGTHLWSLADGRLLHSFQEEYQNGKFAFSADGKLLAVSGYSGRILLWDIKAEEPRGQMGWAGANAAFLAFSPDDRTLAVCDASGIVRLLSIPMLREVISFTLQGFFGGTRFSPGGDALIAFNVFRQNLLLRADSFAEIESNWSRPDGDRIRTLPTDDYSRAP